MVVFGYQLDHNIMLKMLDAAVYDSAIGDSGADSNYWLAFSPVRTNKEIKLEKQLR